MLQQVQRYKKLTGSLVRERAQRVCVMHMPGARARARTQIPWMQRATVSWNAVVVALNSPLLNSHFRSFYRFIRFA